MIPTDSFAPKIFAIKTTFSVEVPESPAFDIPMHIDPSNASTSIHASAGKRVFSVSQSMRRSF
jgi:hypothetical protein